MKETPSGVRYHLHMANFFEQAIGLLRRPAELQPRPQIPQGKRPKVVPPLELPVTEAEIRAALDACFPARQAAEDAVASAADRREELLMSDAPDADELLLDLDRNVNLAAINLERLDRLEPTLHARLRQVSGTAKKDRFAELRDEVVAAAQAAMPALRVAAEANERWRVCQAAALMEYPDAFTVMPGVIGIEMADVRCFAADVEKLRRTERQVRATPFATSMDTLVKEALETGADLDAVSVVGPEIAKALGVDVTVVLTKSTTLDGRKLVAGTELDLPPHKARALIDSGKARSKESK